MYKFFKTFIFITFVFFVFFNQTAKAEMIELSNLVDVKNKLENEKSVLLVFYIQNSAPCENLLRICEVLNEKYGEQISILKINAENSTECVSHYQVNTFPDLRIFKDRIQNKQVVGLREQKDYDQAIEELLA